MKHEKYSKDFQTVNTLDSNGHLRTKTVYNGDYFVFEREEMGKTKARVLLAVFLFLIWAVWIFGLVPESTAMRTFYVVAPYVSISIGILFMTFGASDIVFSKGPFIREGADHINNRFPTAAICAFCLACVSILTFAVLCIRDFKSLQTGDVLFGISNAVLAAFSFLFYKNSRHFRVVKK